MRRDLSFRAMQAKPVLLKSRRNSWQERQHWLGWGALLTLVPGLGLLPTVAFLVVSPRFLHARFVGFVLLAGIAVCESLGIARLARCLRAEFDLLSALAFGAIILLLVVLMYTGVFLVTFFFLP